jgi:hypothetical protein
VKKKVILFLLCAVMLLGVINLFVMKLEARETLCTNKNCYGGTFNCKELEPGIWCHWLGE